MTIVTPSAPLECTVLVVTYDSAHDIDGALAGLRAESDRVRMRVVVVDNASSDGTVALVRRRYPEVEVLETGANLGYAGALNRGSERLGDTAAVVLMNADVRLQPGAIAQLLAVLVGEPGVDAAAPRLVDVDGRLQYSLRREPTVLRTLGDALFGARWPLRPAALGEVVYDPAAYEAAGDVDWATGAVLAVRADAWRACGPWDERFFLYSEETDFARRLRATGGRIRYEPRALAAHAGAGSGTGPALDGLLAVNRVRYAHKHHGVVAAAGVRAALLIGAVLRFRRPSSRARLRVLVRRSHWSSLPRASAA